VRFDVLGEVRVADEGGEVVVSGRLRRTLLALLLARANTAVSVDWLGTVLWGDTAGPRIGQKLQVLVHHLRRTLGEPDRVELTAGGYRLRVAPGELDAERFETLVTTATSTADPARRADLLRDALDLWRGRPYQDLDVVELADAARRLTERRLVAREELYAAELARGRHPAVVAELRELAAEHPLRERPQALLMTALYADGRQAEALAAYQEARRVLVDELGLEPGPRLRELERRILAGEPIDTRDDPRPAQLPHAARGFVGRRAELAELDRLAGGPGPRVVAITGTAGVGKTALATHWAHGARDAFPDGQLYVDLRGYGPDRPLSSADVLAGFLRALGVDDAAIPRAETERAARFRTLVDRKRLLVVLDNAATVGPVRPLLPGTASCFVVVTSRDSLAGLAALDGAHRITLDRLPAEEASALLTDHLGQWATDTDAIARLVERCARLPLALRIAAERVAERRGSISDLDDELADEQSRLDVLDTGDPHASVRAVLSWSYHRLAEPAAQLFRRCGLRPGHDIDPYALAALAGEDPRTTRRLVDELVRAHLLEVTGGNRIQQHDLLWAYSAELAEQLDSAADRAAALTRLFDHYRYVTSTAVDSLYPDSDRPRFPRPDGAVPDLRVPADAEAWLVANHTTLLAAAAHAGDHGWPAHTADISAMLARHIRRRGHHAQAFSLHGQLLAIATRLGDPAAELAALTGLGHAYRMTGGYPHAIDHYGRALAISRDTDDRAGELAALGGLGDTYFTVGEHQQATDHYRELLAAARAAGHRLAELKALAGFGHADMWSARYAEGEEYYRRAHTMAVELRHRAGEITGGLGLGHVHLLTGRYPAALEYLEHGLAVAREVGHPLAEQAALAALAEIAARTGDHDTAVARYTRSLAITRAVGISGNQAHVLVGLGHVHLAAGEPARAARLFEQALAIADDTGLLVGTVLARHGLGCAAGEPRIALDHHRASLALAEELALPRQQVLAHDGIGTAHHALGSPDAARHHWRRAVTIGTALGIPETDPIRARLG
jgi:DNA-binding SARP family transcriptional activator/tetratricopeptide (TPR) repeat protein